MGRLTEFFGYYDSTKSYTMSPKLSHLTWKKELDYERRMFGSESLYGNIFNKTKRDGMSYQEFRDRLKQKGYDTFTKKWDSPEAEREYYGNINNQLKE